MLKEEFWLEEQIKKKKRFILLMLFVLLLGTAVAAALLKAAMPPSSELANVKLTPDQPATPLADASARTLTPDEVHGDEFSKSTVSPNSIDQTTPQAVTLTAPATEKIGESGSTGNTSTDEAVPSTTPVDVEATSGASITPETTPPIITPPNEDGSGAVSTPGHAKEPEAGQTATITPTEGTPVAEAVSGTEASESITPAPLATSRRIHESWDILNGDDTQSSSGAGAVEPPTSTAALTTTATLSETMAVVPPDGLPVTGAITRRGMNWAAMAMAVVLLGAGAMAVLHPGSDRR